MQFLVYDQHDFGPGMATFYGSTPSENLDQNGNFPRGIDFERARRPSSVGRLQPNAL